MAVVVGEIMNASRNLLSVGFVCASLSVSPAFSQTFEKTQLAVINTSGEVWSRDLTPTTVGAGQKLDGPSLFGGPDDAFVLGSTNAISVVTKSGALWTHSVEWFFDDTQISGGSPAAGTLFGGPDAKYVLADETSGLLYVVTTGGKVWAHAWGGNVSGGYMLTGPSLFGAPDDKYVLLDGTRLLVVNMRGEVWAHDLACTHPVPQSFLCPPDAIGGGYLLAGPRLFGAANDKYVVLANGVLMVINTSGEVWARSISASTLGIPYKLSGPTLFGGANDKYVVVYDVYRRDILK